MKSRKSLILKEFLTSPALGVVFGGNAGLGQGVKQSRFTDVGQAHDATLQTHEIPLEINPTALLIPSEVVKRCKLHTIQNGQIGLLLMQAERFDSARLSPRFAEN